MTDRTLTSSPANARRSPAEALANSRADLAAWLSRLAGALVSEHRCAPPSPDWHPVASHLHRDDGLTYRCPECGQVHARGH